MVCDLDPKPETAFSRAVNTLQPGASGHAIVALLDGKAKRTTALGWRAGRRHAPQWALQLLARKIRERSLSTLELANHLDAQKERPGLKAGALNLAKWRARKRP
jgi:hypothetical protein